MVDLAIALGNEMSRGIDELISGAEKEEIVFENLLCLAELLLGLFKVKVNVQGLDEVSNRVVIFVVLLADNAHEVLELLLILIRVAGLVAAGDNGGSEVAQDPGAAGLDGVDVGGREEHVRKGFARGFVIKEGE